jgi:hypothetical protein
MAAIRPMPPSEVTPYSRNVVSGLTRSTVVDGVDDVSS